MSPQLNTPRPPRKPRIRRNQSGATNPRTVGTSGELISATATTTAQSRERFQTLLLSVFGATGACTCRSRRALKRQDFVLGHVGFSLETASQEHLPECPASQTVDTDWSQKIVFKYTGLRSILNSTVQLSFAIKSGAGNWTISPSINYRPTVDRATAPAFRILDLLGGAVSRDWSSTSSSQWEKFVALALAKVLRLFQTRKASPLAVDSKNESLAHFAATLVRYPVAPVEV